MCNNGKIYISNIELFLKYWIIKNFNFEKNFLKFFNRLYLISKKIYINKLNNKLKITTFQN